MNTFKNPRFVLLRPSGNDTCLIEGIVTNPARRKEINDRFMKRYPHVEQVGFVRLEPGNYALMMAGGEFCGNATRSTAYLALDGQEGEISIEVLGVTKSLRAGVTATGEAWTEMPGSLDFSKIEQESEKTFVVHLDGITHIVTFDETIFAGQAPDALKDIAMRMIRERALDARPATGVMFVRQSEELLSLEPVVYVSAIDTLFYESACGSGTAAIGMALAMRSGTSEQNIVLQPSGMPIEVRTEVKDDAFTSVRIQGPIHILPQ